VDKLGYNSHTTIGFSFFKIQSIFILSPTPRPDKVIIFSTTLPYYLFIYLFIYWVVVYYTATVRALVTPGYYRVQIPYICNVPRRHYYRPHYYWHCYYSITIFTHHYAKLLLLFYRQNSYSFLRNFLFCHFNTLRVCKKGCASLALLSHLHPILKPSLRFCHCYSFTVGYFLVHYILVHTQLFTTCESQKYWRHAIKNVTFLNTKQETIT
jgi:hypothetical protein